AARAAPWAGPSALPHSSRSQSSRRSDWARRRDGPTAGSANPSWSTWVIRRAARGSEGIRPPRTGADPCPRADVAAPHLSVIDPTAAGSGDHEIERTARIVSGLRVVADVDAGAFVGLGDPPAQGH